MKILLVNWGTKTAEYPLKQSDNLGKYDIYLATTKRIPPNIKRLFPKDKLIYTNPYNPVLLIDGVVGFCEEKQIKFDVVTTFFEMNVGQTAALADYLNCDKRLPLANALQTSVNKYLMRMKLKYAGINQPCFLYFDQNGISKAYDFYKKMKSPVVIKPVHSGHSYGSRLMGKVNKKQFKDLFKEGLLDFSIDYDEWIGYINQDKITYLAEEFIEGNVYSFDGVVRQPGQITFIGNAEYEMADPPILQQIGHTLPIADLGHKEMEECKRYTISVIKSLGLQFCGFHCELKYFRGKPYLIEISGRLPGGAVLDSYQAVSKINIFDLFFSIFEEKRRIIEKNEKVFLSETKKIYYETTGLGKVVSAPKSGKYVLKNYLYQIHALVPGDTFRSKDNLGAWLFEIVARSKCLDSKELKKIRDRIFKSTRDDFRTAYGFMVRIEILYAHLKMDTKKLIKRVLKLGILK